MLNKSLWGIITVIVGAMLVFSLIGCDLDGTSPESDEQGVVFSLNLPHTSYMDSANNLITQTYSYMLIVEKDNAEVHNQEYLASEEKITLELSTGLHYFTLQAFNDEGIMLGEGSASGNLVIGMNQVKITLIPVGVYVEIETEWERPGDGCDSFSGSWVNPHVGMEFVAENGEWKQYLGSGSENGTIFFVETIRGTYTASGNDITKTITSVNTRRFGGNPNVDSWVNYENLNSNVRAYLPKTSQITIIDNFFVFDVILGGGAIVKDVVFLEKNWIIDSLPDWWF